MELTPDDVEGQEFRRTWLGYDRREVDRFLDLVAVAIADLRREREELARRLDDVTREAGESLGVERLLKRALVDAQRVADETVGEARREADELVAEARRRAEGERRHARAQVAGVRQAVDELRRFRDEYRTRVQAVVERAGELPALPPALGELAERAEAAAPPPAVVAPDTAAPTQPSWDARSHGAVGDTGAGPGP